MKTWKHNSDILPRLQAQLEMLLEAHGKFQPIVYDTQGIHDDGSDVVFDESEGLFGTRHRSMPVKEDKHAGKEDKE